MRRLVAALTIAVLVAAGCGGDDGGESADTTVAAGTDAGGTDAGDDTGGATGGDPAASGVTVTAVGFDFEPNELVLPAGETATITVKNEDSTAHTFTIDEADVDEEIEGGETATVEVDVPAEGSLEWYCRFHPSMQGTINP